MKLVTSVPSKPARIARLAASACWRMQSRISSFVITLRRAEVRQRLRHVRGLDAVAQVDAAVAAGVQDLLDRHRALFLDVGGDALELRQELVVEHRDLAEVRLAFAERVRDRRPGW